MPWVHVFHAGTLVWAQHLKQTIRAKVRVHRLLALPVQVPKSARSSFPAWPNSTLMYSVVVIECKWSRVLRARGVSQWAIATVCARDNWIDYSSENNGLTLKSPFIGGSALVLILMERGPYLVKVHARSHSGLQRRSACAVCHFPQYARAGTPTD